MSYYVMSYYVLLGKERVGKDTDTIFLKDKKVN